MYSRTPLNNIHNILSENPKEAIEIIKSHIAEAKNLIKHGVKTQLLIREISNAMLQLLKFAMSNHLLEKLFRYFMKDIKSWLITLRQISNNFRTEKTFLLPFLSECACIGMGVFNRFKNDMREKIEVSVMEFVKKHIADKNNKEINYLSLGSGELLQDFININKILLLLADSGRKDMLVEITLIDPLYADMTENLTHTCEQFECLTELANELGILFAVKIYASIDKYSVNEPKNQDVIMATDFENFHTTAFKAAIKAHKMLKPDGIMSLSFWNERYILGKTQSLSPLPAVSYLHAIPATNKNHVKIASLIERNIYTVYPIILPYIQQLKDCKMVTLTLPHPQKKDKKGFWLGAKYPDLEISCTDLHYFFSLFLSENIKLTLDFVTGNKNFDKLLLQFREDQDLVVCSDRQYTQETETLFEDIAAIHKKFPIADVLFKMQTIENTTSEPEKTFSCCWIYNQAENSTTVLNGNDSSMEVLADAYQYVVSMNIKQNCDNQSPGRVL